MCPIFNIIGLLCIVCVVLHHMIIIWYWIIIITSVKLFSQKNFLEKVNLVSLPLVLRFLFTRCIFPTHRYICRRKKKNREYFLRFYFVQTIVQFFFYCRRNKTSDSFQFRNSLCLVAVIYGGLLWVTFFAFFQKENKESLFAWNAQSHYEVYIHAWKIDGKVHQRTCVILLQSNFKEFQNISQVKSLSTIV